MLARRAGRPKAAEGLPGERSGSPSSSSQSGCATVGPGAPVARSKLAGPAADGRVAAPADRGDAADGLALEEPVELAAARGVRDEARPGDSVPPASCMLDACASSMPERPVAGVDDPKAGRSRWRARAARRSVPTGRPGDCEQAAAEPERASPAAAADALRERPLRRARGSRRARCRGRPRRAGRRRGRRMRDRPGGSTARAGRLAAPAEASRPAGIASRLCARTSPCALTTASGAVPIRSAGPSRSTSLPGARAAPTTSPRSQVVASTRRPAASTVTRRVCRTAGKSSGRTTAASWFARATRSPTRPFAAMRQVAERPHLRRVDEAQARRSARLPAPAEHEPPSVPARSSTRCGAPQRDAAGKRAQRPRVDADELLVEHPVADDPEERCGRLGGPGGSGRRGGRPRSRAPRRVASRRHYCRRRPPCQATSENPPSTTSTWPRTISASGRAQERDRGGDVVRLDEAAGRVRGAAPEHLVAVREVLERAGLDDARRDGVDADPRGASSTAR